VIGQVNTAVEIVDHHPWRATRAKALALKTTQQSIRSCRTKAKI
jgi:hypothetical protein